MSEVHAETQGWINADDVRRGADWVAGYTLLSLIPRKYAHRLFVRLRTQMAGTREGLDHNLKQVVNNALGEVPPARLTEIGRQRFRISSENRWATWSASRRADWPVRTEVAGLEHATAALSAGRGIVFWGMSFCGTLFPKIALQRAGIKLVQLSTTDHAVGFPLTKFRWRVLAPAYCLAENRYLERRIYMPDNGSTAYLKDIGKLLKHRGAIWIAAERRNATNPVSANFLGRQAPFPPGGPVLAFRNNAALIPAYTERLDTFHYRLTLLPPIERVPDLSVKAATQAATEVFAQHLEKQVLADPGSWDWNSWVKHLPPRG